MKINYVENKNGKLFSFHRHDYKENTDAYDNYINIDGGFDYVRYSGELKQGEIKDLMPEIREQFKWGNNFNENNNRLPKTIFKKLEELDIRHINNIIEYLLEKGSSKDEENNFVYRKQIMAYILIFIYELQNRLNNGKTI